MFRGGDVKDRTSAQDVLRDIEFELAQGAIACDELGQAIQAVKRYHNRTRGEILNDARQMKDVGRILPSLFQIHDMLITLLQETAAAIQVLRVDLRKMAQMTGDPVLSEANEQVTKLEMAPAAKDIWAGMQRQGSAEVESAMGPEALSVGREARPVRFPIIGRLIQALRDALHNLVLFYVKRLAERQVLVNQTYGERLLTLMEAAESQQWQIERLTAQMRALETRLGADESEGG
jgi:hypothetical protein